MGELFPIHVDDVPTYEPFGDCIRVRWRTLDLYIPVPICLAAMGRCQRAIEEWQRRNATVIPLRPDVAAE